MVVSSFFGSPAITFSAASFAMEYASSFREAGTNIRVGALHDWPVLLIQESTPARIDPSKLSSSKIILADFPPSS